MLQEIEPFTEATRDLRKLRDHLSPAPPKLWKYEVNLSA